MANNNALHLTGLVASADYSTTGQFYAVKLASTDGQITVCSSTLDVAIGILQNDPASGQEADVLVFGESMAYVGPSDVAIGDVLTSNTTGQLEDTTTDNHVVIARALEASSASGDLVQVLVLGPGRY